ncbi:MAG TPA: SET domain-containing methyltransferase [Nitrososphaerales archaeon]|nr:SET domain-containing methyltransferase [Nitrososphaerales archaeon]
MGLAIRGLVEVRPCPHGRGLFACRKIERGSVIREFRDLVLTARPTSTPRGRYALQIGENEYWDGFPRGSPDYWSNFIDHSDDPNAVFVFDDKRTMARLKAAKRIEKGQEIFLRYDSYHSTNPRFGPDPPSGLVRP